MRFADVVQFALTALGRHKVRTLLTLVGVTLGSFTLVVSLSVGLGVQATAMREFRRYSELREIEIWPIRSRDLPEVPEKELEIKGTVSEAKRQRLRAVLSRKWLSRHGQAHVRQPLNQERLRTIAEVPHVEAVMPEIMLDYDAVFRGKSQHALSYAVPVDSPALRGRIVAGRSFPSDSGRGVLVHEFLLYQWGLADDTEVEGVLGQPLRLDYRAYRWEAGAPATRGKVLFSEEFTITGVFRDPAPGYGGRRALLGLDADLILPVETARDLFFRTNPGTDWGCDRAVVRVDAEENVREVLAQLEPMGLMTFSLVEAAERVRLNIVLITFATGFVAAVALLVACLGITNIMLMSVLERTHEIGVMKAVGAGIVPIQLIFLVEGGLIGMVGGVLGLLASWAASFPGDAVARSLIEKQTGHVIEGTVFAFPFWLVVGIPLCTALVTTLAALYPARRAARVDPIAALRYE